MGTADGASVAAAATAARRSAAARRRAAVAIGAAVGGRRHGVDRGPPVTGGAPRPPPFSMRTHARETGG